MKKAALLTLVVLAAVGAWIVFRREPAEPAPPPVAEPDTVRQTTSGEVIGFIDHGAQAWLGLPYAEAPVGPRRWRAPLTPQPWVERREALTAGARCPQKVSPLSGSAGAAALDGSEDCLYLNVWAPPGAQGLPVMFWIHGGGNSIGSGEGYVGTNLALAGQVVVVTINYRLGPFGWFAHPGLATGEPADDSGNYGLLDIIRALEWTRDNIAAFGGNPDNVTVFGESAGAVDTIAMLASPLAKGLFHRAISQSGGFAPLPMAYAQNDETDGGHPYSAREIVNRLLIADGEAADREAAAAIQDEMDPNALRDYLYGKSAEEIFALWEDRGFGMINTPNTFADGYVLPTDPPLELFSDPNRYNAVPVMLGTNRDEPALFMTRDPRYSTELLGFLPRLKDEDAYLRTVRYGALAWRVRGVDSLADAMATGNANVFAYRFDYDDLGSLMGFDLSKALGAAHFLEVPFVFGDFVNFPLAYLYDDEDPERDRLSATMMSYWAQFAHAGDPARGRGGDQPAWTRWGRDGMRTIIFDTDSDGGVRMADTHVTRADVVNGIADDTEIADQRERCTIYLTSFRFGAQFDRTEYERLGQDGCRDYPPESLLGG